MKGLISRAPSAQFRPTLYFINHIFIWQAEDFISTRIACHFFTIMDSNMKRWWRGLLQFVQIEFFRFCQWSSQKPIKNVKKIKINKFLERQNVIIDPTITGMRLYSFSKRFSIAKSAALELAMSKIVSTWRISAPPSNSALAWVVYGSTSLSKAMNTKVMLCKLIVKTGVNVRLLTWQIVTYDSKKWKMIFLTDVTEVRTLD